MKKYLLGAFAIVLAVAFSSFNHTENKKPLTGTWFEFYQGTDQTNASNYRALPIAQNCTDDATLCAIFIATDSNQKLESGELSTFFSNNDNGTLGTLDDQPETSVIRKKG